jgi:uncharacterized protein (DUF924 family)
METQDTILEFWFGLNADDKAVAAEQSKLWWMKHPETDQRIRQRFEAYVAKAANGELDTWSATPRGRLALILLTDQFPRNIYRDTPQAFSFDPLARSWSKEGIRHGLDKSLRPIERVFFYLPLEHSESLEDQEQSVALYQELIADAGPEQKSTFDGFLDFAIRHRDIVKRFDRFPHRNRILGRKSTAEEIAFLQEKGSSF